MSNLRITRNQRLCWNFVPFTLIFATTFLQGFYLTTIIFSPGLDPLRGYSHGNVDNVRHTMGRRGLNLQDPKTHNILFRPEVLPKGIFRRAPPLSNLSTKVRRRNQYMVEARHGNFLLTDLDPMASEPLGPAGAWSAWGFPYPLSEEMKVLAGISQFEILLLLLLD